MARLLWFLGIFIFSVSLWAQELASHVLMVGQSLNWPVRGQFVAPNQKILKINSSGGRINLMALAPGWTYLKLDGQDIEVSVLTIRQNQTRQALQRLAQSHIGVSTHVRQGSVTLEGTYLNDKILEDLLTICSKMECEFENRLTLDAYSQQAVKKYLQSHLQGGGFILPSFSFTPSWVAKWPSQGLKKTGLQQTVNAFGIKAEVSQQVLAIKPSVKVQLLLAEVRKQKALNLGISWPTQLTAQVLPKGAALEDFSVSANFLEHQGLGRTLAAPSLIARSGAQAEFLAGGEIPIRLIGERTKELQWKKYGIVIRIEPKLDMTGRMSLNVECEVSSIDGSVSVEGVPGFKTNRLKTHFDMTEPRAIVLSGLIRWDQHQSAEGIAGLGQLPILGALFQSEEFRNDQTELVVLMKPTLILPQEEN